jgi:hypothetical protein
MNENAIGWDLEAERDLWRSICAPNSWFSETDQTTPATHPRSLWYFIRYAWGVEFYFKQHADQIRWLLDDLHGPYVAWLQKYLLQWKANCQLGGIDRMYLAIILPRGFGKTVTATKSASIWTHLDEPDMSTLFCSATSELSEDILNTIQEVISGQDEDSWFGWLYGNWRKGAKDWTKKYCNHGYRHARNISEPALDITGVDIGMTGYHHRQHVWDDPITRNKFREGGVYLRGVHEAVNASWNACQTNGLIMFVLTRYADGDVAGKHLKEEGIATWDGMPCPNMALFSQKPMGMGVWHVYFMQTEDELTGEPIHPLLWDKKKITEAKTRDPEDFACQQQNNPGTGERAPLIESQLPDLFMDYRDFRYMVPVESASVHLDTAFKKLDTIRKGDFNAIGVWLKDARHNGLMYLDTDLLRWSNEWREEDFNDKLVEVLVLLRRRAIRVSHLTDEIEPGGKAGTYKNRLLGLTRQAGVRLHEDRIVQLNRGGTNKKARIRTSVGHWAENYVRILLHKDINGKWIIPPVVLELFNQILRIDVVEHDDIADALADGFIERIWQPPTQVYLNEAAFEGYAPIQPGDECLRDLSGRPFAPPSSEEIFRKWDEASVNGPNDGNRGDDGELLPRDPV